MTEEEVAANLWKNEKAAQEDPAAAMLGLLPEGGLDIDVDLDPVVAPRATGEINRRADHQGELDISNIIYSGNNFSLTFKNDFHRHIN